MPYSDEALAFAVIPASHQVRLEDRVSFAYIEYATIVQDRTGVVALREGDEGVSRLRIQLPVSGLAVLMMGPGTSITAPALTSCTRSGCTVVVTGGDGYPSYTHATPLSSSAKWAIAQATIVSDEKLRLEAAVKLYKRQLNLTAVPGASIKILRGLEGRAMRDLYRTLAKKYQVKSFKRCVEGEDEVNIALNVCNSILYGCAASVCAALGLNPALGIIHRGDIRSFLYDLADLYKPSVSIPVAFSCSGEESPASVARVKMRKVIHERRLLVDMLKFTMGLLENELPNRVDDRLISDAGESEVAGHTSYGVD